MSLDVWDGIMIGVYLGVFIGWLWNRKPPVIRDANIEAKLVIDEGFVNQIETAHVMEWLKVRNLTWMPKGAVFDPKRKVEK